MSTDKPAHATAEPTQVTLPGLGIDPARVPGHWLLARMGKRVLRPGGRALTTILLDHLAISPTDDVVELAPGLGATAQRIIATSPRSYTGVERDPTAAGTVTTLLRPHIDRCINASAQDSGLEDASADVVTGEAFLTMQPHDKKQRIVQEAFRILRPGGRYGLHEMCLHPDTLDDQSQHDVRDALQQAIRVGARPLTIADWRVLLEDAGFEIKQQATVDMLLLHLRRMIDDEGFTRTLQIAFNIVRDPDARRRILAMRTVFRTHRNHLGAVAMTATKPATSPMPV